MSDWKLQQICLVLSESVAHLKRTGGILEAVTVAAIEAEFELEKTHLPRSGSRPGAYSSLRHEVLELLDMAGIK